MEYKNKEIVIGQFVDINSNKISKVNGEEVCFIAVVENFNNFISKHQTKHHHDTAILARYSVDESFANRFMHHVRVHQIPNNSQWFYKEKLDSIIESFERQTNFQAKLYESKTTRKDYSRFKKFKVKSR